MVDVAVRLRVFAGPWDAPKSPHALKRVSVVLSDEAPITALSEAARQFEFLTNEERVGLEKSRLCLLFVSSEEAPIAVEDAHLIYYGVDSNGRLKFDWSEAPAITIGDLRRACEAGYYEGRWNDLVVLGPEGMGSGGAYVTILSDFLRDVGVELAVGASIWPARAGLSRLKRRMADRRAASILNRWEKRGISEPWVIRLWVERKPVWTVEEVAARLQTPRNVAEQLLLALGYEFSSRAAAWVIGTSSQALERRRAWEAAEEDWWQEP